MLEKLTFTNFKAFAADGIDIKPITILVGPNNSGKSSVLASTRILSQTLQSYGSNVPLLLNGALGDFGTFKDLVYLNDTKKRLNISLTIKPDKLYRDENSVWKASDRIQIELTFKFNATLREVIVHELVITSSSSHLLTAKYDSKKEKYLIDCVNGINVPPSIKNTISKYFGLYHFLPRPAYISRNVREKRKSLRNFVTDQVLATLRSLPEFCNDAYQFLVELEYVGAMRQPPSRSYLFSGEKHQKVGVSGEHATSIIAMDSLKRRKSKNIRQKVIKWLKSAELASDIKIEKFSDRHYEIHIQNNFTNEYQNYADVGYGNSQIIPILVAGYNLSANQTLAVEEPEIHLHPNAQAQLGDFFLDLYENKVRSIIETHSEYLIVRLQQHVASKKINPDDIVFYYVYPSDESKIIKKLTLDGQGFFKEPWPKGFFPHRLEEAKKLAGLRESKGSGQSGNNS